MLELLGLLVAFFLIFILRFRGVDFALTILSACVIIGLTCGQPLTILTDSAMKTVLDPTTWDLVAAVAFITVLGYVLKETGLMVDLIGSLRSFMPGKALLAIIPALFGILSMPGGALMSAPFNEAEADRLKLNPEQKTFTNVWFRHVWFWASPISSTTIILCKLAEIDLRSFILWNIPIFLASWLIGWVVISRFIKEEFFESAKERHLGEVIKWISPILITVVLTLISIPIWLSVLVGILFTYFLKRVPIDKGLTYIWKGIKWDTVSAVIATLYFRYLLSDSGAVTSLFKVIMQVGLPLLILVLFAPIIIGSISGQPQMGIGIILPLLLPLLGQTTISNVTIIFAGIVFGYTMSPMHLCLILTNQYYRSDLNKVYPYLVPPLFILYIFAVIYHLMIGGI